METKSLYVTAVLALCAVAAAMMPACRPSEAETVEDTPEAEPLQVVATIRPLELIVRELLSGSELAQRVNIVTVIAPEVSPHGFEPTPAQIARLRRADIVVYNGFGLDDWAARDLPASVRAVRFADAADAAHEHDHDHDHDHGHEHGRHDHDHSHAHGGACEHGSHDEHFWVDPELVADFAVMLTAELAAAHSQRSDDGDAASPLQQPLREFLAAIRDVDRQLAELLSPHAGRSIVTHHNVFSRLAGHYGLGEPVVLRPLASVEPSPADLRRAIERIRAERIQAILIEPQFSAAAAERVRAETGVELVEVDPLGAAAASWSELMQRLGNAVAESLDPQ